jgi:transposase
LKRIDPHRLVFLDESGVRTGMRRLYGRSVKGCRIVDRAPAGRWETHTVVAAIRTGGVASAMVTRKAINSITFHGFIEKFLCPTLSPGDVVVMDNLAVHKVKGIEQAGAELLYLPPYSPDFNPIEQAWSKVKSVIRSLCPPTYRRLVRAIGEGLRRINSLECQNYFHNAGYPAY